MALTIDTTAGGVSANSYCSIADADAFLEQNIHTFASWDSISDDYKTACLILATRLLDEHVQWYGTIYNEAQALSWPRKSIYNKNGQALSESEIPQFLKNATAEFARALSEDDRLAEPKTLGLTKIMAGPIDLRVRRSDRRKVVPMSVWNIIRPYGVSATSGGRVLVKC